MTPIDRYLQTAPLHELVKYSSDSDYSRDSVAFSGAPQKHPYDPEKLILISDPFSAHTAFYEFNLSDIAHVDELPSLVSQKGDALVMVKVWIKKGRLGLRYEPFVVEDTTGILQQSILGASRKVKSSR